MIIWKNVDFTGVAELAQIADGTEDVSVTSGSFEGLGNDPRNRQAADLAKTVTVFRRAH